MAFELNGKPISIDNPFTAPDGTRYPNLRDPAIRARLGVVEVADPPSYDQRFYWGVDNPKQLDDKTETPEGSDKPVTTKGLKSQWVAQIKSTAGSLLAPTDWRVIRAAEGVRPLDQTTRAYRASVRAKSDEIEAAILACTTVEELIAVLNNQDWPTQE
jgi:hypothetical protein